MTAGAIPAETRKNAVSQSHPPAVSCMVNEHNVASSSSERFELRFLRGLVVLALRLISRQPHLLPNRRRVAKNTLPPLAKHRLETADSYDRRTLKSEVNFYL